MPRMIAIDLILVGAHGVGKEVLVFVQMFVLLFTIMQDAAPNTRVGVIARSYQCNFTMYRKLMFE